MKKFLVILLMSSFFFGFKGIKRKKTEKFDFTNGVILKGNLHRPDGEYFEARKRNKHWKLLTVRKHFKEKLKESVNEL